tara:strand:- start:40 stop:501 length:462 start_codon:yes stop_codon:yes gene_type:complete
MVKKKKLSKNVQTVIDILQDEVDGNVSSALKKVTKDYTMTWVNQAKNGKLFPTEKINTGQDINEIYAIKGRQYDIKNIAESDNLVMIELIESYPDSKTKKVYRTPLVLVLEIKGGKIRTGRHYLDPSLSHKFLTKAEVKKAYKKTSGSLLVIK